MSIAALIRGMAAAGAPPEAIALAVEAIEQAQAGLSTARAAATARKQRQRSRERDMSRDGHGTVTGQGVTEPAPSPPPLSFPQTPKQTPPPHPHPEIYPHVRAEISIVALAVIADACRRTLPKPAAAKRRWPKAMPPPPRVSDDQWAGFISHRTAKRSPLTDRAYELLLRKLSTETSSEWPPGRIVDEMVERGWLSFKSEWLTKPQDARNGPRPHQHDRPSGWAPRPGMEGAEPASLDDDGFGFGARH